MTCVVCMRVFVYVCVYMYVCARVVGLFVRKFVTLHVCF